MKSDIYPLGRHGEKIEEALKGIERAAEFCGLNNENALVIRLLAEEEVGMARGILDSCEGRMWLETREGSYEMHLLVNTAIGIDEKDALLSVAKTKGNVYAKGVLGKIRSVFADMLISSNSLDVLPPDMGYSIGGDAMMSFNASWSMSEYIRTLQEEGEKPEWDGLEKSIIQKMATDVIVGVRSNQAEMIVIKRF